MASCIKFITLLSLISQLVLFVSSSSFVVAFVSNNHGSQRSPTAAVYYRQSIAVAINPAVNAKPILRTHASPKMSVIEAPPSPPAVVVAPAKQKKQKVTIISNNDSQSDASKDRGWLVRLYNDPMNKREFVSRCLMEICGLDDGQAYSVMMKAHQTGIAVIGNYPRELAELYKVKLSGEGLLIDMVPADDE